MLKRANCGNCRASIPLDCGFFEFRFAPRDLVCDACGCRMPATFSFRSNWMGQQIFRACTLLVPTIFTGGSLGAGYPIIPAIFGSLIGGGLVGLITGAILGSILGAPLQLIVDTFSFGGRMASASMKLHQDLKALKDEDARLVAHLGGAAKAMTGSKHSSGPSVNQGAKRFKKEEKEEPQAPHQY